MGKKYIMAHDLGTSGDKASLYDENGKLAGSVTYNYPTCYLKAGYVEQDPEDWWRAVCSSTKSVLEKTEIEAKDVVCISFSGQMMGCLPVDSKGSCLRKSIIWADMRAVKETELLKKNIGESNFYRITGSRAAPSYSLEKMMWIKNNEEEVYKKTAFFLNSKDYIVYRLTGKFATDYSDASGTNLLDIEKKVWSPDILKASEIEASKLPELHASTDIIGYVKSDMAGEVGLTTGTAVVMGGGDGSCATVGAGAVEEGDVYNYFGSSSWISVTRSKPMYDTGQRTFNLCLPDPGYTMALGTMQSAGSSYEWMRENLCLEEEKATGIKKAHEILNLKAASSVPGANGLLFLPYLLGERCPYWNPDARGAFIGLTRGHRRQDMIRAVYEGPIFNLRIILDIFRAQGVNVTEMRAIGGAIRSDFICGLMADICEVELLRPEILEEATSFGAAVIGGVGAGVFDGFRVAKKLVALRDRISPDPGNADKYRKLYLIFKDAYQSLLGVYEALAGFVNPV